MNYIMFLGYPRSGSTISGKILGSHPKVFVAHQFDVLKYMVKENADTSKLISATISKSKKDMNQLQAIGTKAGHRTLKILRKKGDSILWDFEKNIGMPVKYLQVIRNPYDNIGRWARNHVEWKRRNKPNLTIGECIDEKIEQFDSLTAKIVDIEKEGREVYKFYLENLIDNPDKEIKRLFDFIEVEISKGKINSIKEMLYKKPTKSRDLAEWDQTQLNKVKFIINKYDFLRGYTW